MKKIASLIDEVEDHKDVLKLLEENPSRPPIVSINVFDSTKGEYRDILDAEMTETEVMVLVEESMSTKKENLRGHLKSFKKSLK